jgi:hypothetical protein
MLLRKCDNRIPIAVDEIYTYQMSHGYCGAKNTVGGLASGRAPEGAP